MTADKVIAFSGLVLLGLADIAYVATVLCISDLKDEGFAGAVVVAFIHAAIVLSLWWIGKRVAKAGRLAMPLLLLCAYGFIGLFGLTMVLSFDSAIPTLIAVTGSAVLVAWTVAAVGVISVAVRRNRRTNTEGKRDRFV